MVPAWGCPRTHTGSARLTAALKPGGVEMPGSMKRGVAVAVGAEPSGISSVVLDGARLWRAVHRALPIQIAGDWVRVGPRSTTKRGTIRLGADLEKGEGWIAASRTFRQGGSPRGWRKLAPIGLSRHTDTGGKATRQIAYCFRWSRARASATTN